MHRSAKRSHIRYTKSAFSCWRALRRLLGSIAVLSGLKKERGRRLKRLGSLLWQRQKRGLVLREQVALGRRLPAGPFHQIGLAAGEQLLVERLQRVHLWHRDEELAAGETEQALDMPPLIGPPPDLQRNWLVSSSVALNPPPQHALGIVTSDQTALSGGSTNARRA